MKKIMFIKGLQMVALIAILSLSANELRAQPKETITNKSIIEMSKAGLSKDIILTKIESSTCKFDLSTAKLVELKNQGVNEDVIAAMMDKQQSKSQAAPPGTKSAPKVADRKPSLHIEAVNFVNAIVDGKAVPLEKQVAGMRTRSKAFGYGGVKAVYEIAGETSPVKITAANATAFAINTGGAAPDFALYKLKVEKKKRHAVAMSAGTFSGAKTGEGVITLSISKLGSDLYKLTPDQPLEPGEYYFSSKAVSSTNSMEVFAFTVE